MQPASTFQIAIIGASGLVEWLRLEILLLDILARVSQSQQRP